MISVCSRHSLQSLRAWKNKSRLTILIISLNQFLQLFTSRNDALLKALTDDIRACALVLRKHRETLESVAESPAQASDTYWVWRWTPFHIELASKKPTWTLEGSKNLISAFDWFCRNSFYPWPFSIFLSGGACCRVGQRCYGEVQACCASCEETRCPWLILHCYKFSPPLKPASDIGTIFSHTSIDCVLFVWGQTS